MSHYWPKNSLFRVHLTFLLWFFEMHKKTGQKAGFDGLNSEGINASRTEPNDGLCVNPLFSVPLYGHHGSKSYALLRHFSKNHRILTTRVTNPIEWHRPGR